MLLNHVYYHPIQGCTSSSVQFRAVAQGIGTYHLQCLWIEEGLCCSHSRDGDERQGERRDLTDWIRLDETLVERHSRRAHETMFLREARNTCKDRREFGMIDFCVLFWTTCDWQRVNVYQAGATLWTTKFLANSNKYGCASFQNRYSTNGPPCDEQHTIFV